MSPVTDVHQMMLPGTAAPAPRPRPTLIFWVSIAVALILGMGLSLLWVSVLPAVAHVRQDHETLHQVVGLLNANLQAGRLVVEAPAPRVSLPAPVPPATAAPPREP
jgi:hypothetical protein